MLCHPNSARKQHTGITLQTATAMKMTGSTVLALTFLRYTAGGPGFRVAARFSNTTVALIILVPLTFTGVFLGR